MPLMKVKPTSPGRRSLVKVVTPDLHKGEPHWPLVESQKRGSGRNNAGRVTIQTTQFGGRITVSPQPLDSAGLGIQGLSAVTPDEARVSLARIIDAISLAGQRVTNLEVLRDSLAPGGALTNELSRLLNTSSPGFLPRGSLVNQIA